MTACGNIVTERIQLVSALPISFPKTKDSLPDVMHLYLCKTIFDYIDTDHVPNSELWFGFLIGGLYDLQNC